MNILRANVLWAKYTQAPPAGVHSETNTLWVNFQNQLNCLFTETFIYVMKEEWHCLFSLCINIYFQKGLNNPGKINFQKVCRGQAPQKADQSHRRQKVCRGQAPQKAIKWLDTAQCIGLYGPYRQIKYSPRRCKPTRSRITCT